MHKQEFRLAYGAARARKQNFMELVKVTGALIPEVLSLRIVKKYRIAKDWVCEAAIDKQDALRFYRQYRMNPLAHYQTVMPCWAAQNALPLP
jgi:hypothetical protein